MRVIVFDPLDIDSIREAAKQTRELADKMQAMGNEICKRLAEIGISVAKIHYIPEAWSGNTDVKVSAEPIEKGYKIVASGKDVMFMEFGAGVTSGLGYDTSVITPPVSIEPGSWSEAHNGPFAESGKKSWWYNKHEFQGLAPQMGMYYAAKEVQQRVEEVARKVFDE